MRSPDFDDVIPISLMADWTDEQWAENDARVAAAAAKADAGWISTAQMHRSSLGKVGWPELVLREARAADLTKQACVRLLANDFKTSHIVVLSGPAGTGKTVAAARWADGFSQYTRFVRAATFAASSRYNAEQRAQWFDAHALVLDDLGAEYLDSKGSFLVDLDELIDTYYADLRPLVITTNCNSKQFTDRYGSRVMDRLRQCAKWFSIGGESLRKAP